MLLETMALAGGALAIGFFSRPVQSSLSAIWRPRPAIATREPPKQVQSYEFCAGPTACESPTDCLVCMTASAVLSCSRA